LILGVVGVVITLPLNAAHVASFTYTTTSNGVVTTHYVSSLGWIIQIVLTLGYGMVMIGARGQTVGMMAARTRCLGATDGRPISYGRALGRGAFEYLLFVLCIIPWVIGILAPLWDGRNQTWWDKVASTVVVKQLSQPVV
jgi:uncharacterized RDD family membrane protein YckC